MALLPAFYFFIRTQDALIFFIPLYLLGLAAMGFALLALYLLVVYYADAA